MLAIEFLVIVTGFTCVILAARVTLAQTYPRALVVAVLMCLAFAQVSGDVLSALHAFRPTWLVTSWVVAVLTAAVIAIVRRGRLSRPSLGDLRTDRWIWASVAAILGLAAASGMLIAPTNYDSQTYHLPRALHWLQQGSLAFFTTPNMRENINAPLPSLQHALLLVVDPQAHFSFVGQWLAASALTAAAAVITRALFPRCRPAMAALFVVSTPLVVVMASTTQADLLACVPLAGAAIAFAQWLEGRRVPAVAVLALSVGLAVAIKLTALLLIIPVAAAFANMLVRQRAWRPLAALVLASGASGFLFNVSYFAKLRGLSGSDMDMASAVVNGRFGVDIVVAGLVKNSATVLQVPNDAVAGALTTGVVRVLSLLHLDPYDPAATFPMFTRGFAIWSQWSDSTLGEPLQVILAVIALVIVWNRGTRCEVRRVNALLVIAAAQFVLLAAVLRWQPWNSRFLMPVVLMFAPVVALAFGHLWRWLRGAIVVVLVALSVLLISVDPERGLLMRGLPVGVARGSTTMDSAPLHTKERTRQITLSATDAEYAAMRTAIAAAMAGRPAVLQIDVDWNDYREYLVWYLAREIDPDVIVVHTGDPLLREPPGGIVRLCLHACGPASDGLEFDADGRRITVTRVAGPVLSGQDSAS